MKQVGSYVISMVSIQNNIKWKTAKALSTKLLIEPLEMFMDQLRSRNK